jgi:hypothetical protein
MALPVRAEAPSSLNGRMIAGIPGWAEASTAVYAAGEAFGGLGKGGLITIIIVSIIAIVTLVWIFRETRKRD